MKGKWILGGLKFALFAVLVVAVFSFVVMNLWNCLMPTLFGLHLISFWQAIGLLVLSKVLFGRFRGRPGRHLHWRRRLMARWAQMTPEQREKFREGMRGRCGAFGSPTTEPKV
jgi:hypothetical protein